MQLRIKKSLYNNKTESKFAIQKSIKFICIWKWICVRKYVYTYISIAGVGKWMESIKIDRLRKTNLKLNTKRKIKWTIEIEEKVKGLRWDAIEKKFMWNQHALEMPQLLLIELNTSIVFKDTSCTCTGTTLNFIPLLYLNYENPKNEETKSTWFAAKTTIRTS